MERSDGAQRWSVAMERGNLSSYNYMELSIGKANQTIINIGAEYGEAYQMQLLIERSIGETSPISIYILVCSIFFFPCAFPYSSGGLPYSASIIHRGNRSNIINIKHFFFYFSRPISSCSAPISCFLFKLRISILELKMQ